MSEPRPRTIVPPRPAGAPRRLIWPMLAPIIRNNSIRTGKCFAKARTLRAMIFEDFGYVCGERSVQRAILREWNRGTIGHKWIRTNRVYLRGKRPATNGLQCNWFPSDQELRLKRWDQTRKRKNRAQRREAARAAGELVTVQPPRAPSAQPSPIVDERTGRRRASVPLLGELVAPTKLAELLEPPAPAPPEQVTFAELEARRRAEVDRQLVALRAAGLDKPPE